MIPRWCHRLYALVAGYFWKACPNCGRMFGGHEAGGTYWESAGVGWITCSHCPGDYGDASPLSSPPEMRGKVER